MTDTSSNASLVIHPDDPHWIPDNLEALIHCLRHMALLSDRINPEDINSLKMNNAKPCYLAGDKFLDLIMFMGCSPQISFAPDGHSSKFSFIRLITTADNIAALTSQHTCPPRCPACHQREKNWRMRMTAEKLECSACGKSSAPWFYNWRKTAGFGRIFIEITEIFPKEALPQQTLLDRLRDELGVGWTYFYYYDSQLSL